MPTLRPKLNLRPIRDRGRNFRIDFNMLQILPAIAALYFAICKKTKQRLLGTHAALFSIFGRTQFFYIFILLSIKKPPHKILYRRTPQVHLIW
jgi:hypothetical protein